MKTDIYNLQDIKSLVDQFYLRVRADDLLRDIFNNQIGDDWPKHLEKMYRFWQTVLLHEYTYHGSPFLPHVHLPIEPQHFSRWLDLFYETVDDLFEGEKATEAKMRADKMAKWFARKLMDGQRGSMIPIS